MKHIAQAVLLGFAFAACPLVHASAEEIAQLREIDIQRVSVQVRNDTEEYEFTVIDARMDETATAAVFFGLIGAAVNSAANDAEDDAKEEPLRATAEQLDLDGIVAASLMERLGNAGAPPLAETPESATHTLVVDIGEWGLVRRAQRPDNQMRAFLKMNISILDERGRRIWGPQREHSIGQLNAELSAFTPEVFRTEIETLAHRAGRQAANRLIYR